MNRVLRTWLVGTALLFVPAIALAFDVPAPEGYVTDVSHVLTHEDRIEREISAYHSRTGNEIGVLIVPSLDNESIEDVAHQAFKRWGVGKKNIDNGVLILVATKEHRTRIETGRGIGDKLTDLESSHILDRMAPALRDGRFDDGIMYAIADIEAALGGGGETTKREAKKPSPSDSQNNTMLFLVVGLLGFAGLCVIANGRHRQRRGYSATAWDAHSTSSFDTSSSYSSYSSFGGGGDGGGSSFGGGDSGGGGASGSY